MIVEIEVLAYPESRFEWTVVGVQVDLFIFNASPKPLYKDVVDAATFAIHADLDLVCFKNFGEIVARKLAALVGVEYLRLTVFRDRIL